MPGGGLKKSENFQQGIERELSEEPGFKVGQLLFHGVYNNFYERKNDSIIVFFFEDFTSPTKKDKEIEAYSFFSFNNLPTKISPGTKRKISECLSGEKACHGQW